MDQKIVLLLAALYEALYEAREDLKAEECLGLVAQAQAVYLGED